MFNRNDDPISISDLFKGKKVEFSETLTSINDIAQLICLPPDSNLLKNSKEKLEKLIYTYAKNISTIASHKSIYQECQIDYKTYITYLTHLENINIVGNLKAWSPTITNKSIVRKAEKKQFTDPKYSSYILNLTPVGLFSDIDMFRRLFETYCTQKIREYVSLLKANVYHYHDSSGLKVDLIIELEDQRWSAMQVILANLEIEEAAKNLLKLKEICKVKPSFLMIITTAMYAYCRLDGIFVMPISLLTS